MPPLGARSTTFPTIGGGGRKLLRVGATAAVRSGRIAWIARGQILTARCRSAPPKRHRREPAQRLISPLKPRREGASRHARTARARFTDARAIGVASNEVALLEAISERGSALALDASARPLTPASVAARSTVRGIARRVTTSRGPAGSSRLTSRSWRASRPSARANARVERCTLSVAGLSAGHGLTAAASGWM